MNSKNYTESDWKLFRKRLPQWQESYMEGLIKSYRDIIDSDRLLASEKFWTLEKRIRKQRKHVGACAEMRRSQIVNNLVELVYEGAIDLSDLEGFSDRLRKVVTYLCSDLEK